MTPTALLLLVATLGARPAAVVHPPSAPFDPGRACVSVKVGSELIPYRVFGIYLLPEEELVIELLPPADPSLRLEVDGEAIEPVRARTWKWRAPAEPGLRTARLLAAAGDEESLRLNLFVMVPASRMKEGLMNGYRIGDYPEPRPGKPDDAQPRGYVEVTPANQDARVSPHFTLGEFLCHQEGGFPKYLVLRERLLRKLEALLEAVNEAGVRCDRFAVLSGYRTPYYNEKIGNVAFSRHQWGDAADVYVDADADGRLDDLDRDGVSGMGDALRLLDLFERAAGRPELKGLEGGLGPYGPAANRGPFVHVDSRGSRARWSG